MVPRSKLEWWIRGCDLWFMAQNKKCSKMYFTQVLQCEQNFAIGCSQFVIHLWTHCVLVVIAYEEVEQSRILVFSAVTWQISLMWDWIPPVLLCKPKAIVWEPYIHRQLTFHFLWVLILQSWLLVLLQPSFAICGNYRLRLCLYSAFGS